MFHRVSSDQF